MRKTIDFFRCKLKHALFADDVKALDDLVARWETLSLANKFFIEQGIHYCQHQINSPGKPVPASLMHHGIPDAAKQLGIKSLRYERKVKADSREWMKEMVRKTGVKGVTHGVTFLPNKDNREGM